MEKCGESLRKRSVVSEDRISELLEDLILKILSYVFIIRVIRTSVLSKRWRSLWKMLPKLTFDSNYHRNHLFSENVGKTLLSHKAPVLESLLIRVTSGFSQEVCISDVDIGIWIGIAFARHVRELVLNIWLQNSLVRLSRGMFSSSNTLETLKLQGSILVDVPSPFCIKSLRTMHLYQVDFKGIASFSNLLSSCQNLENLIINRDDRSAMVEFNFVIVAPSLKRLSITDSSSGIKNGGYVINTPSLNYLKLKMLSHCECRLIENASVLVEAKLRSVSHIANDKIMGCLKLAKRLCLDISPLEIKYPTGSIFHQLVHLEMYTLKAEWWNLLTLMLDSSPRLQVLKLIESFRAFGKRDVVGGKWNQPKNVPKCLLSHLKLFEWTRYHWEREEEIEVATYILRNARQLKSATFSTRPIHFSERNKVEECCNILKELDGVVRASSSCNFVFVENL